MKRSRLSTTAVALLASLSLFATAACGNGGSGSNETVKDPNSADELVKLAQKDG